MEKFEKITLFKGATSEVEFDFSEFDFSNGGKCVFSLEDTDSNRIIKNFEFEENKKYKMVFTDEFTATLDEDGKYKYDIMYMLNDERYPQCLPSEVEVLEVVNEYVDQSN